MEARAPSPLPDLGVAGPLLSSTSSAAQSPSTFHLQSECCQWLSDRWLVLSTQHLTCSIDALLCISLSIMFWGPTSHLTLCFWEAFQALETSSALSWFSVVPLLTCNSMLLTPGLISAENCFGISAHTSYSAGYLDWHPF